MKKELLRSFNSLRKWIGIMSVLLGQSLIFISSYFANDSHLEQTAEYATNIVKNNTKGGKYCAVTVEDTPDSGSILYDQSEFYNLYGIFKQTKVTFGSMINLHEKFDIHFNDIESPSNLSIFYVSITSSTEYHDHYKNFLYPFELMFSGAKPEQTKGKAGLTYISVDQANKYLIKDGHIPNAEGMFNSDQYESLLGRKLPLVVDGKQFDFVIENIYYQTNYYYEGISEIAGEFIVCGAIPNPLITDLMNVYFMSEYTYQNKYFMRYINESYSNYKYLVRISHKNIVGAIDDSRLLRFYGYKCNDGANETTYLLLLTLSIIILASSFVLLVTDKCYSLYELILSLCFLIPYLIFKIIFICTGNVLLFSGFACKVNTLVIVASLSAMLIAYLRRKKPRKVKMINVFEINI